MLATEGEHGSEAEVREERALRSEASLASCLSALPAPVLSLPRNDKLASLTGPNKGKPTSLMAMAQLRGVVGMVGLARDGVASGEG